MDEPENVCSAYDRIADAWRRDRLAVATRFREKRLIDELITDLPRGAHVLDVGCGFGAPIGSYLLQSGFAVTGIDGSSLLLGFLRESCPGMTVVKGDMRTVEIQKAFDALIAWDSVFHVTRADHPLVFERFHSWLAPGGKALISLGGSGEKGFLAPMHGVNFFYSADEPEDALRLLRKVGFEVLRWEIDDPSSRGHMAVLLRKPDETSLD